MASKWVEERIRSSELVIASLEEHSEVLGSAIAERLPSEDPEGLREAVQLLVRASAAQLGRVSERMKEADLAHLEELADDPPWIEARDRAESALRDTFFDLRSLVRTVYGDEALETLALKETPPRSARGLLTYAERAKERLRYDAELTNPARRGAHIDRIAFAEEIGAQLPLLSEALENLAREEREAEESQAVQQRAMLENDALFARVTALAVALFRLGGEEELAREVRPSGRRPGVVRGSKEPPELSAMDSRPGFS
jgi:hypothetical protein